MSNQLLLAKVLLWRLVSIPISTVATYLYTGEMRLSLELTLVLTVVLTSTQFVYERLWRYALLEKLKKVIKGL